MVPMYSFRFCLLILLYSLCKNIIIARDSLSLPIHYCLININSGNKIKSGIKKRVSIKCDVQMLPQTK